MRSWMASNKTPHIHPVFIYLFGFIVLIFLNPALYGQELRIKSAAVPADAGLFDWTVSVAGDAATLGNICYVEYSLPLLNGDTVQRITDRATHFACSFKGAINASVVAKIVYATGQSDTIVHELIVDDLQLQPAPGKYGKITTNNSATYAGKDRWNWTVFIEADDQTLNQIECVEYRLHPTFPDPVQKVCAKGSESGKGFFLTANGWGTFTVKLQVIFKDGERIHLKHDLLFSD
jgi:hypothetical protein